MTKNQVYEADVIIVGAGVAGALIAYKLSKRGIKVIVFEAGKRFSREEILHNQRNIWEQDNSSLYPETAIAPRSNPSTPSSDYMESVGPVDYSAHYLRGVGGTTWHWQAVCHRLLPEDMQLKSRYGVGFDWPFTYDELEAFYAEADLELGVSGDTMSDWGSPRSSPYPMNPIAESYSEKKIKEGLIGSNIQFFGKPAARNSADYDDRPTCVGHHNCSNICPIGAQYSAIVHVNKSEALGAKYMDEALITEIIIGKNNRVTGVRGKRPDDTEFNAVAKAFILAANPIETARLCLSSSNETFPNGVANSSMKVGRRLMDHPIFNVRFSMPYPVYAGRGPLSSIGTDKFRAGELRKKQASSMLTFENLDLTSEIAADALKRYPHNPLMLKNEIRRQAIHRLVLGGIAEQLPSDSNRVFIDHSRRDSSGMPHIQTYYSIDSYTNNGLSASKKLAEEIIGKLGGVETDWNEGFFATHASGTMMMGHHSNNFVCDQDGRTHDHYNLFVAGSSLFPSSSAANPTLTIAALALRTEHRIASYLGSSAK